MQVTKITGDQAVKIVKAAAYVGLSAVISFVIAQVADKPDLFGPLTPLVNVALVTLKQAFTSGEYER